MKPQLKRELAIDIIHRSVNVIIFYASADAAEDFREFGHLQECGKERYSLIVDARYDFEEVLKYIENYH